MSRLSDIVSYRRKQGGSVTGSLAGGIKERLKEKFDPRQLINQKGLMTALFPGLKTYQAKTSGTTKVTGKSIEKSSTDVSSIKPIFENIQVDSKLTAKNLSVLPSIHRDFNVIRQNIVKLLKLENINAATKADMYFKAASKREEMYESQFSKLNTNETTSPERIQSGISAGKILDFLAFGGILGLTVLAVKGVSDAIERVRNINLKDAVDDFTNFLGRSIDKILNTLGLEENLSESEVEEALSKLSFSQLTEEQKISLLEKQAVLEGMTPGSLTSRMNNPGAMIFAPWQKKYGGEPGETVKGADGKTRTFAKFPSIEKGKEAQRALWESESYRNKPLSEVLGKWVDPDNKKAFENYMKGIAKSIGLKPTDTKKPEKIISGSSRLPIESGTINSAFGPRTMTSPGTNQRVTQLHKGIDFGMPEGKNVLASDTGEVVFAGVINNYNKAGKNIGYGQTIKIKHDDGTFSLYSHLKENLVKQGDKVVRGQVIAKSGGAPGTWYSGGSTGPHLHFELLDKSGKAIDPTKILEELRDKKTGDTLKRISSTSSLSGDKINSSSFDIAMGSLQEDIPVIIFNNNTNQQNIIVSNKENPPQDYLPLLYQTVIL